MVNDGQTLVDTSVIDRSHAEVVNEECAVHDGRYRLLQPLGSGGMGNVYLAEDRRLARQVAIKTIRPELSANQEVRARIKRECRLHAAIGAHPHIVTLFDTFEENSHIYLVMEYCAGSTLAGRLAASNKGSGLSVQAVLDIVRQLLLALETIHGAGIVHRDIKTANILLSQRDEGSFLAKLTDFGIARAALEDDTVTRLTALDAQGPGTPLYMAPERIDPQSFGPIGPASDVYAVGVILYELLLGQPPFKGTLTEIFSGHLVQPPALDALPGDLPPQMQTILQTALAKQVGNRFSGAREFLEAVEPVRAALMLQGPLVAPVAPAAESSTEARTVLAHVAAEADLGATQLHPRGAQKHTPGASHQHLWRWAGGGTAVVILVCLFFLVLRETGANISRPQPIAPEAVVAITSLPPEKTLPTQESQSSPPAVSALETLESVRQPKRIDASTLPSRTGGAGSGEWQVVENHSRKIR